MSFLGPGSVAQRHFTILDLRPSSTNLENVVGEFASDKLVGRMHSGNSFCSYFGRDANSSVSHLLCEVIRTRLGSSYQGVPLGTLDERNRAIVIAESPARVFESSKID